MLADLVIKPYRQTYDPKENLGPNLFVKSNNLYERIDYQVHITYFFNHKFIVFFIKVMNIFNN